MYNSESESEESRLRRINHILHYEWDPIGIGGSPEALHEYDGYAQVILGMIRNRATQTEITSYLWWAETENMGLDGERERTEQIAGQLHGL